MRVLSIDPPFKRFTGLVNDNFPVGLAYVAAALRADGHEVTALDVDALEKGSTTIKKWRFQSSVVVRGSRIRAAGN
jgi:hypothetical protein